MSQVGVDRKSWGSHVVVVRPCMVVDHCRHVVCDCHHCCVAASDGASLLHLEPSGSGRLCLTPPLGVTIR